MSLNQKRTLLVLLVLGALYFTAFIFPNARGARDENMLFVFSNDETITYPYVLHMLATPQTFSEFQWRLLIYGDYHYGYPFYFFSMLAVLPVKLLYGDAYTAHTGLNLTLLRQLISVLPMVLAAGVLVFAQTRFRSLPRSAALFVLLLIVPGIVRNNLWWWHPDALSVLAVALTLLFLILDRLRLGRFFFLAAAACGLAIGIKLVGFFFVFPLAGYVLAALFTRRVSFKRAALRSLGFIALMSAVVLLSNPFMVYASQRQQLVEIQAQKSQELASGYTHDPSPYYQKGLRWWLPTLEHWYGPPAFLALLVGLAAAGCVWGPNRFASRLVLAWFIPYALYLVFFVAVKPDHYWLPAALPLFSSAFNALSFKLEGKYGWLRVGLSAAAAAALLVLAVLYLRADYAYYVDILRQEALAGY